MKIFVWGTWGGLFSNENTEAGSRENVRIPMKIPKGGCTNSNGKKCGEGVRNPRKIHRVVVDRLFEGVDNTGWHDLSS